MQVPSGSSVVLRSVAVLQGHAERVWHAAWSPRGNVLATCGSDKAVRIWTEDPAVASASGAASWVCRAVLEDAHKRTVRRIQWSPDGKLLACASFDATVSVWAHQQDGEFDCVATLEGHEHEVKSVAWDSSGSLLATASRDKSVWIWAMDDDRDFECISILNGHSQDVKTVLWHPTAELLVSCSYDDTLNVWKEGADDDWESVQVLRGHTSTVWDASFDATGAHLVSCSDDRSLRLWTAVAPDRYALTTTFATTEHRRTIFSVDWSKRTGLIASGAGDNGVRIYAQDTEVMPPDGPAFRLVACDDTTHTSDVNCVAWNPERPLLATTSDDGTCRVWAVDAGMAAAVAASGGVRST